ncbi:molybdopterin molybdenumtransferase MoeA [Microbacterium faecale]|uniref:Molybdopterin molybdenumtransferase n=1 Tax=Microbacterium faecale TaxID=1804630 RepID=A0A916YD26_9MICO|nr:gephyrin-like molybdotransferase Glp [Microbacterium faecale]GGD40671.1 molybdopterin molybdenumtransferase MoeA [Microbacterium faecale]
MSDLISVAEHRTRVLNAARPLESEELAVADSVGSTLAADAISRLDIPAFDNSAMDGFAVRHADVAEASRDAPAVLRVVADVAAGSAADPALSPGEAARIMTGARVPTSADTVVPFEQTIGGLGDSLTEAAVSVPPRARGAHIRRVAEDIAAGRVALSAGAVVGALQLSALIAAGVREVSAVRRPRVAVVSTGSELVPPGTDPAPGQIPDSNSALLAELVADSGARVTLRTSVGDDPAALRALLNEVDADVVITSGGVSAGAYEPVKQALAGRIRFDRIAMQPGKPQGFGVLDSGALFFGLPGNPVSVAASYEMFVRPALLRVQGRADIDRPRFALPATTGWRTPAGRLQVLPIVVDGSGVRPATAGGSGSHLVGGLGRAEGYAVVPADVAEVASGDLVDVMLVS